MTESDIYPMPTAEAAMEHFAVLKADRRIEAAREILADVLATLDRNMDQNIPEETREDYAGTIRTCTRIKEEWEQTKHLAEAIQGEEK